MHANIRVKEKFMLDALTLALDKIDKWEIPLRTLSLCTGISASELSTFFTNKKPAGRDRVLLIAETVAILDSLAKAAQPIPVAWKRSEKIKELVDKYRAGVLKVAIVDGTEVVQGDDITMGDLIDG
jgi:hypothetical protein